MHFIKQPLFLGFLIFSLFLGASGCTKKEAKMSGTIEILPELAKTLKPEAVLYIVARPNGETSGPPVAVKRFTQPLQFPLQFQLTAQDAMIPDTPFEGKMTLTARIAQTGSATPIKAGDIESATPAHEVAVGTENLKIQLDQKHQ